eukprot:GHRQ01035622.1.p1 GENE.GHRQ01035622.1~~GHRQ01035622.1.p1  ORF type:complete len:115 (-),score=51.04 GHRQ01035622.1:480-824(-)
MCLQVIKYGVISLAAFQQDLQHWSHLYVGGRTHKPVAALTQHAAAEAACQQNLQSALTASLLLLPKTSSLQVKGDKDCIARCRALSSCCPCKQAQQLLPMQTAALITPLVPAYV